MKCTFLSKVRILDATRFSLVHYFMSCRSRCSCFTIEGQNPSANFLYTGGGVRLDSALLTGKKQSSASSSASDVEVR